MSRRSPAVELQLPPGLRATRATRALVALLRSRADSRFTAADTEAALARLGVAVNRVTVFRALDRLAQAGLLQRRVDDDRLTRYQWRSDATEPSGAAAVPVVLPARKAALPAAPAHATAAFAAQPLPALQFHCLRCGQDFPVQADAAALHDAWQRLQAALQPPAAQAGMATVQQWQLQGRCLPCSSPSPAG